VQVDAWFLAKSSGFQTNLKTFCWHESCRSCRQTKATKFFFCYDPRTISLARVGQCLSFVSHAIVSPVHSDRSNSTISQSLIFLKCSELGDWQVTGRRWVELSRIGLYERGFDAVSAAREADGWCLSTQTIIGGAAESSRQRSHFTDQESTVEHDCRQEGTAGQQTASCFFSFSGSIL